MNDMKNDNTFDNPSDNPFELNVVDIVKANDNNNRGDKNNNNDSVNSSNRTVSIFAIFKQLYGRVNNQPKSIPLKGTPTEEMPVTKMPVSYSDTTSEISEKEQYKTPNKTSYKAPLITIYVNGNSFAAFDNQLLSYLDIVRLAFIKTYSVINTPTDTTIDTTIDTRFDTSLSYKEYRPEHATEHYQQHYPQHYPVDNMNFSVIYSKGKHNTSGILNKGKSVSVVDKMNFTVAIQ